MKYDSRSVSGTMGGHFRVSGGPLCGEQIMGWHITNEHGFTVGVSCDARFVEQLRLWQERDAREAAEARRLMGCE